MLEARGFYCALTPFLCVSKKRVVVQSSRKVEVGILGRGGDPVGIVELFIIVVELYGSMVGVAFLYYF